MNYLIACILFFGSPLYATATTVAPAAPDIVLTASVADQENYIKRYRKIAMREMERSGVPASIKLAQGILESDSGKSKLARSANNHFGIKCGSRWNGDTYYKEDDDYDDRGRLVKSCFRQYRNADASFVAHSEFLRDPAKSFRYGFLFRLDPTDYRGWAEGLRRAGYATNPNYPRLLISLIERYNLTQYDQSTIVVEEPEVVLEPVEELQRGILRANDVSYFVNDNPVSVQEIARQVDVSVNRILDYNENLRSPSQSVDAGDRIYLQKKRRAYRGREKYYTVQEGEDLYDVAQRFGLRLDILARRNRLQADDDPATGEKVKLRGGRVKDIIRLEGERDPNAVTNPVPTGDNGQIILDDPADQPGTVTPNPGPNTNPYPNGNPPTNGNTNSGTDPGVIRPFPPTTVPPATTNPTGVPPTVPNNAAAQIHTVQAGETLYAISRRYGLTVERLKQLNGLATNTISIGQRLRVK